ncbi:MAG TPA: glycosyl hydrolase family 18 protein [Acidimicrobiales bacterium]|nr:glycosyl hydrolase family 18 protein [Acidimicrobiales bacterium]
MTVVTFCLVMLCVGFTVGMSGSASPKTSADHAGHRTRADARLADTSGNGSLRQLGATATLALAPATAPPTAAPATLTDQPPLAARENFAFAPYWTLAQSPMFDITGLSTLAYFSIDVNGDGTLDESGPGWNGFQSQDLADLISRAHAAGERVVLTVTDFGQSSLDALTSSTTAPATLSGALIPLLQSKSLDGVNFDFEGEGSGDQAGLTNLITSVAGALRAADPHWQITMDTYASSAGDPGGFYNIPALGQVVDAFFVMDYELNLAGVPSAASPLTSSMFSTQTTLTQYDAAVPASKVIIGTPFFGIDWPTNNGTMGAGATGGATDIPDSQAASNGPEYWDPVTDTAWTSYQVGGQWHESYYEGENGLYDVSQLVTRDGARGVGIWALGMENDGAQLIAAMDGISPGAPPGSGPQATSSSATASAAPAPGGASTPGSGGPGGSAASGGSTPAPASAAPGPTSSSGTGAQAATPAAAATPTPTTTTTVASITGVYNDGATVNLTPIAQSSVLGVLGAGTLTDFQTNVPAYSCLNGSTLNVYQNVDGKPVAEAIMPTNCIAQDFELP